jgi:3-deoxy-D-manno-octulosonate 8-phosphate phosphatase (KDO 8-P phosphatase)
MLSLQEVLERAKPIRLLVLDVDGVLTEGTLFFGNQGEELKAFNIHDGLGIKLLQRNGVEVAIITGRTSELVARRARDLGIAHVIQGREDKRIALDEMRKPLNIELAEIAYMGDDLPDLGAIRVVGLGMTPADGQNIITQHAHWQSNKNGGAGAVREACELILRAQGKLTQIWESYL